jgi:DNA repair protein RadC
MDIDPTSRLEQLGAANLGDDELLSFLLCRGAVPGPSALATARSLLGDCEPAGLAALCRRGQGELCRAHGVGPARARALRALFELARRMGERPLPRGAACDNPIAVFESVRARLGQARQEHFVVLLLDSRLRKLAEVEVCRGGTNSVFVDPRVVFGPAVREGASAVVLIHNHPSGDPQPSRADIELTERLIVAGELLGIEVVDHIVIGDGSYYSMAEESELPLAAGVSQVAS